jgi:ABC-type glutathione transport system ATPase component
VSPALRLEGVSLRYGAVEAVRGASFDVAPGELFALVGESGSGKSSLARAVAGLIAPSAGRIWVDGKPWEGEDDAFRRTVQMVFQDPDASLNPYFSIGTTLAEPLEVTRFGPRAAIQARVRDLMSLVRLDAALLARRPRALSGGQKQRVAIARALALQPKLLIADEALSALDVATQAAVAALFADLRERLGLAILFISHDLLMVRRIADHVAVMQSGQIVEQGPARQVLEAPQHPHTQALLRATPRLDQGGLDLSNVL